MRRSSYQQIIEWKKRRGDHPRLGIELVAEINALQAKIDAVAEIATTFIEFVPIRLVTILEVYIRGAISEIVDDDDEVFFERAEKLAKGAKIDLAFAAHVDRRELTVGDFVAHAVSVNRIEAVVSVMDTLLEDFPEKLKTSHPRWTEETGEWPQFPIVDDYDAMMAVLSRLFEVRHLLAHELSAELPFDIDEVPNFLTAVKAFIEAADWVVVEALQGSVPRTQLAMNASAADGLDQYEKELACTVSEVQSLHGIDAPSLHAMQEAWSAFADAQATFVASQVKGGSMYSMVWASEKSATTRERIDQLVRLKSEWMDQ